MAHSLLNALPRGSIEMTKPMIWLAFFVILSPSALLQGCGGSDENSGVGSEVVSLSSTPSEMGGDCAGAVPMPESLAAVWSETEQCTELSSSSTPWVVFSPTVVCPRNGQPDCLSTV